MSDDDIENLSEIAERVSPSSIADAIKPFSSELPGRGIPIKTSDEYQLEALHEIADRVRDVGSVDPEMLEGVHQWRRDNKEARDVAMLANESLIASEVADSLGREIAEFQNEVADDEQVTLQWQHLDGVAVRMRVQEIIGRDPGIIVLDGERAHDVVDGEYQWRRSRIVMHVTQVKMVVDVVTIDPDKVKPFLRVVHDADEEE